MSLYIAVDFSKETWLYSTKPIRDDYSKLWMAKTNSNYIKIPSYLMEGLIGKNLTWKDEPVKIESKKAINGI